MMLNRFISCGMIVGGIISWSMCALGGDVRVVSTAAEKTGVWEDAYVNDIQAALTAAGAGGTVLLKPGVYAITTGLKTTANGQTVKSDDPRRPNLGIVRAINYSVGATCCVGSLDHEHGFEVASVKVTW